MNKRPERILGIDPGLDRTGWAVLARPSGCANPSLLSCGLIHTPASASFPERLEQVFKEITAVIQAQTPDAAAIEEMFFMKRAATVSATIQTRGVIVLAARLAGTEIFSYDPRKIKSAVTGNGGAQKFQMQRAVQLTLGLKEIPSPDDVADAMAAALCHLKTAPLALKMRQAAQILRAGSQHARVS